MLLLPPLESLRFFEAAARHQGFARRRLWDKLRQASRPVEVLVVAWGQRHRDRTQRVLQAWTTPSPPSPTAHGRQARTPALQPPPRLRRSCIPDASANPNRLQQTSDASMGTSSPFLNPTDLPTMTAGPCTGAPWRRLPTGHPSMAQPPRHKSQRGVPGHKVAPSTVIPAGRLKR